MKITIPGFIKCVIAVVTLILSASVLAAASDPLPSWSDGPIKKRLIQFVTTVTDSSNPAYVAPADRIATFDNDGTLWPEQPIYTQVMFALSEIKLDAEKHPEWKNEKPFSIILSGDKKALASLSMKDIETVIAMTHAGMTVEAFKQTANHWLTTTDHPRFHHPFTSVIYQPMLEAMNYLRDNGFKIYIVSGGGQDFVRAYSEKSYGVQPEQVIGTASKTQYMYHGSSPELIKLPQILLIDDHAGKVEAINYFIGKKPIIAFGNSDGDQQMLEWTESGAGEHLMLLVHHDDATREYAYDTHSKVGTFSTALMKEATAQGWQVISMKRDWKVIFPFNMKK